MANIPDMDVRKTALAPGTSFIVVAPAGAGKTELLVRRYLTLLKNAPSIDSLVALTFTNKAAEEMRGRILNALKKAYDGTPPEDERETELLKIAKEAVGNEKITKQEFLSSGSFKIATFHSFCTDILRSFPLEAGVSPDYSVYEDAERDTVYEDTARKLVSMALSGKDGELSRAVAGRLAVLGEKSGDLEKQIAALLQERDRAGLSGNMEFERREEMAAYILGQYGKDIRGYLEDNLEDFSALSRELEKNAAGNSLRMPAAVPPLDREHLHEWELIAEVFLTKEGKVRKSLTPSNGFPENFRKNPAAGFILGLDERYESQLADLRGIASKSRYEIDEKSFDDLNIILERALGILHPGGLLQKLDYIELEARALKALSWIGGEPSKAISRMNARISHILVDEAQDLGDSELSIVSKLTEGWQENDGRTVFIVGDPKQSIYRFRKANVAIFQRLVEKGLPRESEEELPLHRLELLVNFRSNPEIIDFVNGLFRTLLKKSEFLDGVDFSEFRHKDAEGEAPRFTLANSAAWKRESGDVVIASFAEKENLLDWFVGEIGAILDNDEDKGSVALLYPRRSAFRPYLAALKDAGISLNVVEGETLADTAPVSHLFNLLKAVLNPRDELSWALCLGAPWFDLGPLEIYEISRLDGSWSEKVLKSGYLDREKTENIQKAVDGCYRMPKGRVVFNLWEDLGGPALYSERYGLAGVEAARKFFELLEPGYSLPSSLLFKRMKSLLSSNFVPPDPEASLSRIQAMTIHKAKGLEFDTVFVLGLNTDPSKSGGENKKTPMVIERLKYNDHTGKYDFYGAPYERNELCYELLKDLDSKRGEQEFLRQNYVALTRAKKKLYLLGHTKRLSKKSFLKKMILHFGLEEADDTAVGKTARADKNSGPGLSIPETLIPEFEPGPLSYEIVRASEEVNISGDTSLSEKRSDEESRELRIRGITIHKLLEQLARGGKLPSEKALEAWLLWNREPVTREFISEVLKEAENAWRCAGLQKLIRSAELIPEWQLEMRSGAKEITIGRLDLVVKKDDVMHIVDYKTGKPSIDLEKFKSQVGTYKQMISLKENISQEKIHAYILFTRTGELREV